MTDDKQDATRQFRGYRFRLYPTPEQELQFRQIAGVARLVYNLGLECREKFWREHKRNTGQYISFFSQSNELTQLRRDVHWIAAAPRCSQEAALKDLDTAFKNFFAGRAAYPTPRRKGIHDSFAVRGAAIQITALNRRHSTIWLPGAGNVRFRDTRQVGRIKSVTVRRVAGKWFASALHEAHCEAQAAPTASVGIDRGVARTITMSTGEYANVPASLARIERQRRRAQRALSRKVRGSARYVKQRRRVAVLSARCARIRHDWLHCVTTDIARRFNTVAIEDLQIVNMTASGPHRRGPNRSIMNQGWGTFAGMLDYKLKDRGGRFIKVPAAYTSQTCSSCGTIDRESRESQASFVCRHCGFTLNADHNAALNILRASSPWTPVEVAGYGSGEAGTIGGITAENRDLQGDRGC